MPVLEGSHFRAMVATASEVIDIETNRRGNQRVDTLTNRRTDRPADNHTCGNPRNGQRHTDKQLNLNRQIGRQEVSADKAHTEWLAAGEIRRWIAFHMKMNGDALM